MSTFLIESRKGTTRKEQKSVNFSYKKKQQTARKRSLDLPVVEIRVEAKKAKSGENKKNREVLKEINLQHTISNRSLVQDSSDVRSHCKRVKKWIDDLPEVIGDILNPRYKESDSKCTSSESKLKKTPLQPHFETTKTTTTPEKTSQRVPTAQINAASRELISKRPTKPESSTEDTDVPSYSNLGFQKRVLQLLVEIRDLIKNMRQSDILGGGPVLQDFELEKLESMEEFLEFEDTILEDNGMQVKIKEKMRILGGVSTGDHIRNIMKRCMANGLMSKMNIHGKKGKFAFGKTTLCKLIKDCILQVHRDATEFSIIDEMSKFLKYAPGRTGGGGWKLGGDGNE